MDKECFKYPAYFITLHNAVFFDEIFW